MAPTTPGLHPVNGRIYRRSAFMHPSSMKEYEREKAKRIMNNVYVILLAIQLVFAGAYFVGLNFDIDKDPKITTFRIYLKK